MNELKLLLLGANVRLVCEGAFSDLLIQWTERAENLIDTITAAGDFEFGNQLNPKQQQFKTELESFVADLDKYQLNASGFVKQLIQQNPNVTFIEVIQALQKQFL